MSIFRTGLNWSNTIVDIFCLSESQLLETDSLIFLTKVHCIYWTSVQQQLTRRVRGSASYFKIAKNILWFSPYDIKSNNGIMNRRSFFEKTTIALWGFVYLKSELIREVETQKSEKKCQIWLYFWVRNHWINEKMISMTLKDKYFNFLKIEKLRCFHVKFPIFGLF